MQQKVDGGVVQPRQRGDGIVGIVEQAALLHGGGLDGQRFGKVKTVAHAQAFTCADRS